MKYFWAADTDWYGSTSLDEAIDYAKGHGCQFVYGLNALDQIWYIPTSVHLGTVRYWASAL